MEEKPGAKAVRVTMGDVALAAGVSQSTVSFVLNGVEDMRISSETRAKVLQAVRDLGYRPRSAGRPPKGVGTTVIGLIVDEIVTSPFAAISIDAIQATAWKENVIVETVMTGGDKEYERAILRKWAADRVRGVIYSSILTHVVSPPDLLLNHKCILMNCYDKQGRFPAIVPAERRGGEAAAKVLIEAGHKRIAFIKGEPWMDASKMREEGFERAMHAADLAIDPDLIMEGNLLPSGGRTATLALMALPNPPEAIFCANDLTAVGCYEALKELGLKVGVDVAVVGYDDQEIAQHLHPTLTTVLLPHAEMGQLAAEMILSDDEIAVKETRVPCPLVPRHSHMRTRA
nr:LacI family DNA-binding transcriptional regulator [uncultured Cohaesibacter sp.]